MKRLSFLLTLFLFAVSIININCEESADNLNGKIIRKIVLKGARLSLKNEIQNTMLLHEGMSFDISLVEQDYLSLMELNYFTDVEIFTEKAKDSRSKLELEGMIDVVYNFKEKPSIAKVIFKGQKAIGLAFLLGDVTVKQGDMVDKAAIITDVTALEKKYKDKGFNYAKVEYEIFENEQLKAKNQVHLIFNITEGLETYISEINIEGNTNISDNTIKNKIKTKERKMFGLQKGTFIESTFYEDIELIKTIYKDQGYVKVEIQKPEIVKYTVQEKTVTREAVKITIRLTEGNQYRYGGIEITGNKIFTYDDLTYFMKLKKDQLFSYSKFMMDMYYLDLKYRNAGYVETEINEEPVFDDETKTITYKLNIVESKRSYIEAVYFKGNTKTKTYVLERAVYTKTGDIMDQSNLTLSRDVLMGMGYFNNVTFEIQRGSTSGLLKIIYILEERNTAELKLGVTISTSSWPINASLFAEINEKNFLGRELNMSGKIEASLYKQGLEVKLSDPWFMNLPVSLGTSVSFYHNWTQKVLRRLTADDYYDYDGSNPSEDDIRDEYDDDAGDTVENNKNYYGATGSGSWGTMGLHDLSFNWATNLTYRFLRFFRVSAAYSMTPIYTFLPSVGTDSEEEYLKKVETIYSESYRKALINNDGWSLKNKISTTFSINTTTRQINPYTGMKYSLTTGYTFGHYDSFNLSTNLTYYLKVLEMDFNSWVFNNVVVFNAAASFIFPGFRNLGGELNGESTAGKGPIVYQSDYLTVDGFFVGRGWGTSLGSSDTSGKLTDKYGFARLDGSIEYRVPISEQFIWFAAFIDIVNLVQGPVRKYTLTDKNGTPITVDGESVYSSDSTYSWMWWEQLYTNRDYDKSMTNWYGLENWYGSIGAGLQLVLPQLPLSFYVVKRFQVNYQGGFEWVGNVPNSPNLEFVLSMVGFYF